MGSSASANVSSGAGQDVQQQDLCLKAGCGEIRDMLYGAVRWLLSRRSPAGCEPRGSRGTEAKRQFQYPWVVLP
jgi:hypothetical protein